MQPSGPVRDLYSAGEHSPNAKGWVKMNCPFCLDRVNKADTKLKLGLNIYTGRFKCFRCEAWGYLNDLDTRVVVPKKVETPPEFDMPSSFEEPDLSNRAHLAGFMYLQRRGIAEELWRAANVGFCFEGKDRNRVIVPLQDERGTWWGWFGRALFARQKYQHFYPKGMDRTRLFNDQVIQDRSSTPLLVVEGCLDALPYFPHAVACLGKPGPEQLDALMQAQRPVVFALDGDAWSLARTCAARFRLDGRNAGFVRLPPKQDPNSVPHDWLIQRAHASLNEAVF